jgi:phage-related protein
MSSSTATVGLRVLLQDSATAGLNALGGSLTGLGGIIGSLAYQWNQLSPQMQLLAETAAGAGIAFLGFKSALEDTIDAASGLQYNIARASLAIHGADQNSAQLQATMINLANTGLFSTQQVADGFVLLGEKGQTATDIINYSGQAMVDLAESINSQTAPAAQLLASSMQVFGADASQATEYANLLTGAFYNGTPSVEQLQSALNNAGAAAALLKVPFSDFLTALDYLTKAGFQGSQAGTALRYMLQALPDPLSKAQEELAALGIVTVNTAAPAFKDLSAALYNSGKAGTTAANNFDGTLASLSAMFTEAKKVGAIHTDQSFFQWAIAAGVLSDKMFDAQGHFIGIKGAVQTLIDALAKLPPGDIQDRAIALEQLFNVRSGQAAQTFARGAQDFSSSWDKLNKDISGTSALKDATTLLDTFKGSMTALGTTIKDNLALIGMPVIQALTPLVQGLNHFFSDLAQHHPDILKFVGGFLLIGTVISGATLVVSAIVGAIILLGGVLGPVAAVIGSIVGVALLLAAGFKLISDHAKQLHDFFAPLLSILGQLWGSLEGLFNGLFNGAAQFQNFGQGIGKAKQALDPLVRAVGDLFEAVGQLFKALGHLASQIHLFQILGLVVKAAFLIAGAALLLFIATLKAVLTFVALFVTQSIKFFTLLITTITGIIKAGMDLAKSIWDHTLGAIAAGIHAFVGLILGLISGLINGIVAPFRWLYDILVGHSIVPDMIHGIIALFRLMGAILGPIVGVLVTVIKTAFTVIGGIFHAIEGPINLMVGAFKTAINIIEGLFKGMVGVIQGIAHTIGGILGGIGSKIGGALGAIGGAKDWLGSHLPHFATGGYVAHPTLAVIGEGQEPEYVVPHSAMASLMQSAAMAGGGGQGRSLVHVPVYLDSKQIAAATLDQVTGDLKMNGMSRKWR